VSPTATLLAALAGLGLDHRHAGAPPDRPLGDAAWRLLVAGVRRERLDGLLAHALTSGGWPATADQVEEARRGHREAMATALVLDRRLAELAPALDAAGVRWRVLKGAAVAHLDEPDPSWRCYGDIDLLVHGDDLAPVLHLLAALGGVRHYEARRRDFDRRFGKGAAVTLPDGVEVDVHRTLALGPYGVALDPGLLLDAEAQVVELGGVAVPALAAPGRFLHACYHAVLGAHPPRLSALRDVALTHPDDDATARAAHRLAREAGGEAVVAAALVAAADTLGWAPPGRLGPWARDLRPDARDRRWLGAHRGPERSSGRRTLLAVEAIDDPRDRLRYVAAVLADVGPVEAVRGVLAGRAGPWSPTTRR
jgi:hypothetical protein